MMFSTNQPLLPRLQKAIRWRFARLKNNHALREMDHTVANHALSPQGQPVAFFNASTRLGSMSLNAAYSLLVSWSLKLSGIPVVHFVCAAGMTRCIHGTDKANPHKSPPCRECIAQSRVNYGQSQADYFDFQPDAAFDSQIANLSLAEMQAFTRDGIPLGKICTSSLRWVMRRYHLREDETTLTLFRHFLRSAWNVARHFEQFLDTHNPRALVVFNGITYPEAVARFLAQRRGIRVISHEVNMQPFTAFFTEEESTFRSAKLPDDFQLTPEQNQRFDEYFSKRTRGQFTMAGVQFWKDIKGLDESFLAKASNFKQIVPVFTNVIFDTSQEHANTLFPHMFAWLDDVLITAKNHPETFFVLRAHPDEARPGKASEESVADWVKASGFDALVNTVFIPPTQPLNSYELITRSKFTMIYTSTIGMESTLLGTPVLCAGRAYFNEYAPAVHYLSSKDAYAKQLQTFLETSAPIITPAEHQQNARNFLYTQLYLSSLPFENFLQEDRAWTGYVALKHFSWYELLPQNNATMRVIQNGILTGTPFRLDA